MISWSQCTVDCKNEITVHIPLSGSYNLTLSEVVDSLSSDCPSLDSLQIFPDRLACNLAGSITPYQVQEQNGDVLCQGVIEVLDTTEPVVVCRELVTIYLPVDQSRRDLVVQNFVLGINDNCDRLGNFSFSPQSVNCSDVGNTINYLVSNFDLPDTVCTGTIQVLDTTETRYICREQITRILPENGFPALLFPPSVLDGFSDNCGLGNNLSVQPSLLFCDLVGNNTYVLSNRSTGDTICTGTVTLVDPSLPRLECVDTASYIFPNPDGFLALDKAALVSSFSDNCSTIDHLELVAGDTLGCQDIGFTTYGLRPIGQDTILCSGVISLQDTSGNTAVECQDNIVISLPLTYDGFDLSPDLFIRGELAGCSALESLEIEPSTLFCFDAGDDVDYLIFNSNSGDTVCTGQVRIQDAGETVVSCADTAQVILPESGANYNLSWRDVVTEFSDNCLSIIDLSISPRRVGCAEAGTFIPYTLAPRGESSALCAGVLEVINETPSVITCVDTIFTEIRPSGFPALVFPSQAFDEVTDNCTRLTDFRIRPFFFFCPDSSATFTLTSTIAGDTVCTGTVVVTGPPSIFGNCEDDDESTNNVSENHLAKLSYGDPMIQDMRVYPNPAREGTLQVQLPELEDQAIIYRIIDLMGRQVRLQKADYFTGGIPIKVEDLTSGSYILQVNSESGQVYTKRFIVHNQ